MASPTDRPSGRHTDLDLEGLIARAHLLGSQGRRTIAGLKATRARLEATRDAAEQRLLHATAALQEAGDRLRAIRAASR
jgi:hypothetical protein